MRIHTVLHFGNHNQVSGYVEEDEILKFQKGLITHMVLHDEPEQYEPTIGEQLTLEDLIDE